MKYYARIPSWVATSLLLGLVGPDVATARDVVEGLNGPVRVELKEAKEALLLNGIVVKGKTFNPLILGGANKFINMTGHAYRIRSFEIDVNESAVAEGESIETDIGITVLPPGRDVSLSSGEEVITAHRYFVHGGEQPVGEHTTLPSGGFLLPPGYTLSIGSVSGLVPLGGASSEISDQRLADRPYAPMTYKIELDREDTVEKPALHSYRSPYRDRSYVAHPGRPIAPFTSFKNTSDKTVSVHGLGVFLSNLTSSQPSKHKMLVLINGQVKDEIELPPHIPGKTTKDTPLVTPYELELRPGDEISVRAAVTVDRSLVFDFAGFILADEGLSVSKERMNVVQADINADGYNDDIDLDESGSIWVGLTVAKGLQDTQDEWFIGLPIDAKMSVQHLNNDPTSDLLATTDKLCLHLVADLSTTDYLPNICGAAKASPGVQSAWGDFNGDGFPDLFQIDPQQLIYSVSLGEQAAMKAPASWATGYGGVDKMFVWDANGDGKSDVMTEWGGECHLWISSGERLDRHDCASFAEKELSLK